MATAAATKAARQQQLREMEQIKTLIRVMSRAFYDDLVTVVIDLLVKETVSVKDEDIAGRLNMNPKLVRKALAKLKKDHIVNSHERVESRTTAGTTSTKTFTYHYWFLDYKYAIEGLKYRIHKVEQLLGSQTSVDVAVAFVCTQCKSRYTSLDAINLVDPQTGGFQCERCQGPLVDNQEGDTTNAATARRAEWRRQLLPLVNLLKQTESYKVVPMDPRPPKEKRNNPEAAARRMADFQMMDGEKVFEVRIVSDLDPVELANGGSSAPRLPTAPQIKQPPWAVKTVQPKVEPVGLLDAGEEVLVPGTKYPHRSSAYKVNPTDYASYSEFIRRFSAEWKRQLELLTASAAGGDSGDGSSGDGSSNGWSAASSFENSRDQDDESYVTVQGKPKAFSTVTSADRAAMTLFEYEAYGRETYRRLELFHNLHTQ